MSNLRSPFGLLCIGHTLPLGADFLHDSAPLQLCAIGLLFKLGLNLGRLGLDEHVVRTWTTRCTWWTRLRACLGTRLRACLGTRLGARLGTGSRR